MEKVCVLMSTYNGEKYLKEQLDSILNQNSIIVDILIRDDGSTDKTLNILDEYNKKYNNIRYYTGENLKSAKSFLDLLFTAGEYDYYSFSDQDDVWDRDKLLVAVSKLKEGYNLYGCKKKIVNSNLEPLNKEDALNHRLLSEKVWYELISNQNRYKTSPDKEIVMFNKDIVNSSKSYNLEYDEMIDYYLGNKISLSGMLNIVTKGVN